MASGDGKSRRPSLGLVVLVFPVSKENILQGLGQEAVSR